MKIQPVSKIFAITLFTLSVLSARAQEYVVTTKGDTLKGEVKPLIFGAVERVQVTSSDRKKEVFPILQVKSYRFRDRIYKPVKTDRKYTFMRVLASGYMTLFEFQPENQVTYDGLFLQKLDGAGLEVPNLTFKKAMKNFLADCPDVVAKIDSGSLGKRDLVEIVTVYNKCIDDRTSSTTSARTQTKAAQDKNAVWVVLEEKVKTIEFQEKGNALDMITEIKNKISRNENVPNFMIEGLKSSLGGVAVQPELDNALNELKK
jgi:hypothetical protein